jgi:hypothetical protein
MRSLARVIDSCLIHETDTASLYTNLFCMPLLTKQGTERNQNSSGFYFNRI